MKKDARKKFETEGLVQLAFAALMSARETLHGAVMHAGMQVLAALLEQERAALCGPRYGHASDREYYRYGYADSSLAVGGRKVKVKRPRTRNRHGHEVASPTWSELASTDPLSERAVEQVLLGVSTRNYRRSLEPLPNDLKSSSTSKSAYSAALGHSFRRPGHPFRNTWALRNRSEATTAVVRWWGWPESRSVRALSSFAWTVRAA